MSVRVCGHTIRPHKPIKIYNLVKLALCVAILSGLFLMPALAAEENSAEAQASIAPSAGSSPSLQTTDRAVPTRRVAEQHSATAMALAMAFGLRNISGPIEKIGPSVTKERSE